VETSIIMQRFLRIPRTLYRIQPRLPVNLRDKATQEAKNRTSFDLIVHQDGRVHPMTGDIFHTPNGMSLRPPTEKMRQILEDFRGGDSLRIYRLQENLQLPDGLVVIHEHSDHYSLQTTRPVRLEDFNRHLTEFLQSLPSQSKQEFIDEYDDIDNQDN
jgi:hypothetical protein